MATYREQINALRARFEELEAVGDPTDDQLTEMTSIPEQINALAERQAKAAAAAESMKAHRAEPKTVPVAGKPQISNPRPRFEDDAKGGFANHKDFLRAVMSGQDDRLHRLKAASDEHSTYEDSRGGYLLPVGLAPGLRTTEGPGDPVAGLVQRIPMATQTVEINARVDKNHSTSVSGGLVVTRRPESEAVSASRTAFEKITLKANSLSGLTYASEELLADSPISFVALIDRGFRDEFASKIMQERLNGTGVGEFEGILNSPAKIVVAKESGQADDSLLVENIAKMRTRAYNYGSAVWIANHGLASQFILLAQLISTAGGVPVFQPSFREDMPDMLLGRPLLFTEHAPGAGEEGELMCVNWSEYLQGDLTPLESGESIHVRFDSYQRTFRFNLRNDGRGWWRSVLTPINGPTLSPFVFLGERST